MKLLFQETQKFNQWWLWVLLIGLGLMPLYGMYQQFVLGVPFGDKPMSDAGLIVFAVSIFALLALFYVMQLKTEIDETEIRMKYVPFLSKTTQWKDIKSAKLVQYRFVGYGIRFGSKYGIVYNTRGNKGLAIELHSGKKFLIGTQKADELQEVLSKYIYPN